MAKVESAEDEPQPSDEPQPRYTIDPGAFEAQGRSAALMALHRRCARCWASLVNEPNTLANISFEEHRQQLVSCCSQEQGYVTPQMPVLEAAFRILLASEPPVLSLQELHDALMKQWATPSLPRSLPLETLRRILRGDRYYGIQEVPLEESSETASSAA